MGIRMRMGMGMGMMGKRRQYQIRPDQPVELDRGAGSHLSTQLCSAVQCRCAGGAVAGAGADAGAVEHELQVGPPVGGAPSYPLSTEYPLPFALPP